MIESSEDLKEKPKAKKVLLFSGGMDSVCYSYLLDPDVLLYIGTGSSYDKEESRRLPRIISLLKREKSLISIPNWIDFSEQERKDFIIPNRNAYLVLKASEYGETVYLSSVYGDRSTDKDEKFYLLMEKLLNHMHEKSHWSDGRIFSISSPYKHLTKTELVREYLKKGGEGKILLESYSCYTGKQEPCMQCKPCVRKLVALINNNITDNIFNPSRLRDVSWLQPKHEIREKIEKNLYRGREDNDFKDAMQKAEM